MLFRSLTGDLQSALQRFRVDSRLADLAEKDVPNARLRLDHVLKLTDEAAHRTLDLVELCGPLVDEAARGAARLLDTWNPSGGRDAAVNDFLMRTRKDADALRAHLSELLMAQGYQDITGQIIRSVIALVDELERVLGKLVQIAEGVEVTSLVRSLPTPANWEQGLGPQVTGIANGDAVAGQDDIDALLSQMAAGK